VKYKFGPFLLLLLLTSCGSSTQNAVSLPQFTPITLQVPTPAGPFSIGTAKEIPGAKWKENLIPIGIPFMGTPKGTYYAATETAWPGHKFVIVAFEKLPQQNLSLTGC
jgi:hypothetical protein